MSSADSLLAPMEVTALEHSTLEQSNLDQAPTEQASTKETTVTDQIIQERPRELNTSNVTPLGTTNKNLSLRDCVAQSMENYFHHLDGQPVSDVYDMVLAEVEAPLLEIIMKYTRHNQTQASQVLGLNRGTLRKKLKQHGLI